MRLASSRDLFPRKKRAPWKEKPKTLTLAELAADKKLPEEFLTEQGVYDLIDIYDNNVVKIAYRLIGGALAPRQRIRRALKAKDGSIWMGAGGRPVPYGLWRIKDYGKGVRLLTYEGGVFQSGASIARTIAHRKLDYLSKPDRLESTVALIKKTGKKEQSALDPRALDLINLENGILNWRTGELRPHFQNYLSTFHPISIIEVLILRSKRCSKRCQRVERSGRILLETEP